MTQDVFGIIWGAWHYVWYVSILVIVGLCALCYRFYYTKLLKDQLQSNSSDTVLHNFSWFKKGLQYCLLVSAIGLLSLAALRPQWGVDTQKIAQKGRDLFIALDISRSMLVQDCEPSRLACAKQKIHELVRLLQSERVGLILFSGSAFVQCPLTTDYAAFNLFLDSVDVETISSGSTSIEKALLAALDVYRVMPNKKHKLLVLFTDGEDFSRGLAQVKEQARNQGLHIFTVGVGTVQGAPIPLFDTQGNQIGHQKDKRDKIIISRLNADVLQELADEVGGTYTQLTLDNSADMKNIAQMVSKFEREEFDQASTDHHIDRYWWFILVGFICCVLEWIL